MIKICIKLKKKIINQSNKRKRILLKAFKVIKCRRIKCLKMLNEREIERKGEQLNIIWVCEISDIITGSGSQCSQFSNKTRWIITNHSL